MGGRLGPALFTIAIALFGLRFLNRDLLPFISDEPKFLDAARAQLQSGWLSFSPLRGSQGLHYGPTVLWLYGLVHAIAGPAPEIHILVMTALVTITNVAAAIAVGRLFGDRYLVPSAVLVVIAASPYHFFWSRLAWDQSVEICSGIVIFVLCRERAVGLLGSAVVGLALGLGLSSHLMIIPFACAAFGYLLVRAPSGKRIASAALALGLAALVNIPYGLYLRTNLQQADPGGTVAATSVIDKLQEPFRVSSAAGTEFFFTSSWQDFRAFSRPAAFAADQSAKILPFAMCAGAIALLVALWRAPSRVQRMTAGFALVVWLGYALFYAWRRLPSYPHYQFPCWWIAPVALAAGLGILQRRRALLYGALGVVWVWSLLDVAFVVDWMRFVRRGAGMPTVRYSTVLPEERAALLRACATPEPTVCIQNRTLLFPASIAYVASVEPPCAGKAIIVADERAGRAGIPRARATSGEPRRAGESVIVVEACTPSRGQQVRTLSYAQAGQARLEVR